MNESLCPAPIEIRNALEGLEGVKSPGGALAIDANGDAIIPVPIMQVKNGGASFYTVVYPQDVRAI